MEKEGMEETVSGMLGNKRMMQAVETFEKAGAGNEERKTRRMTDIHVRPPAVGASQQQQQVQTANGGKSAMEPGEMGGQHSPCQRETREGRGDRSDFNRPVLPESEDNL